MTPRVTILVPEESSGERLDLFLAKAQADLSRSRLQGLIRDGHVLVNGQAGRVSHRVQPGDAVTLDAPETRPGITVGAEAIPLVIVYEDDAIIVVDKPAGLVVHPGAGVRDGTLVNALLHHAPEMAGVGGPGRPGIVHRLDKDTSGLLVAARTERAYRVLIERMRERVVKRVYRAIVWGDPRTDSGVIEGPIGRDPNARTRMAIVRRGGKPARTKWRVLERFGPATSLEVTLETGRTHQIRVHLAHLRHPVVGDAVYGGRTRKLLSARASERSLHAALLDGLLRQALHAWKLELAHPITGARLRFTSALPDDMNQALELLRAYAANHRP
jgi:23S rRNA pseudouridine1911/1915/1917 synthase